MKRAVILAALLALAACAPAQNQQSACTAGRVCLHFGNISDPASLDPHLITSKNDDNIISSLFVGLMTSDPQDKPIPGMATSWETTPDGLVWTFHLRDAAWSDGVPVTADDFVFGMRRLLDPKTAAEYAWMLYAVRGAQAVNDGKAPLNALRVEAVDARTLRIHLLHPVPYMLELAKHMTTYPAPKHVVERYGPSWIKDHYVSNGPYMLESSRLGDRVHLVKNPRFYDAANVCIDDVYFYPTTDSVAAERRVRRGELDLNNDIQSNRIPRLKGEIPDYVRINLNLATTYMPLNSRVPAFRDKRVRQALSMAVDREFIAGKLLRGGQKPAYTYVPPGIANYTPPPPVWASWPFEKRQAEARRLLAAAGYGPDHPLKIEITHRNTADPSLYTPSVQADWAQIGVQASLAPQEGLIAYQSYRARDFQVADAAWSADYNDPKTFLDQMQSQTGSMNYGDYNNPEYDRLLAAADNEPDAIKRAAILSKAEGIMIDDTPIIPIWFWVNKNLVNPRVTGFAENVTDNHRVRWKCKR